MTSVLGISAFYHDSAAALLVDGRIVAAAQEERFSRRKHDAGFPDRAVRWCLEAAELAPADLDVVAFYDKPLVKFERLLETYLAFAPRGFRSFLKAMPPWLGQKLFLPREVDRGLDDAFTGPIHFARHHESHAASAFFPSPYEEAAVLTLDGVGEWTTTSWGTGRGNRVRLHQEIRFPHSLGLLYSAFTHYLGFKVNSGEYKVMGLAPFGEPRHAETILDRVLDLKEDGSYRLDQRWFRYGHGLTMTGPAFHRLFGGPPRRPESEITQRHMDLAASIQKVTEEAVLRMARHVHARTGLERLCLAGGVALNCVANGRVLREGPFSDIWIQPAAGDAGGALGAALVSWHHVLGRPRAPRSPDAQRGSLLGPAFEPAAIRAMLDARGAPYRDFPSEDALLHDVAALLEAGKVVGFFSGPMEFGPRALGARSILADARDPAMQSRLNRAIKFRESFRPFAPSVLEERAGAFFEIDRPSPYMLLTAAVRSEHRETPTGEGLHGVERIRARRSRIPAVTHLDHSARVQTVGAASAPRFHRLLQAFEERTGIPLLVNTSFNVRGEPIVCTPEDAYRCFMVTDMDALVLEDVLCHKTGQPPLPGAREHRTRFGAD